MRATLLMLALTACGGTIDLDVDTPEEVAEVCRRLQPEPVTIDVYFDGAPPGCDWGQSGNLGMAEGVVTARREQFVDLDMPSDAIVCGLGFDFDIGAGLEPVMEYDDNMFFLYDGVVLAASHGPLVDVLPLEAGLPIYDWSALAGTEFVFTEVPTYCLGEDEGLSDCEIPPPETRGALLLHYGQSLVDRLALRAALLREQRFGFVTIGDNDPALDCRHEPFQFTVDVPYIPR